MFGATVGWSHRAALKASLFPEEGGGEKEKAADRGVNAVSARPASAVVAVDGETVLLSASSSPPSGEGMARRLASFRRRGERGGFL